MKTVNPTWPIRRLGLPATCVIAAVATWLSACTHDTQILDSFDSVCYQQQVAPLLAGACGTTSCHSAGSGLGSFDPYSYESIMLHVSPGNPRESNLYQVITANGAELMPPHQPLAEADRSLIHIWIAQGALASECNDGGGGGGGGGGTDDSVCFVQDVLPVFASGCATTGCHDAATAEEGYVLTDYAAIVSKGIKPFDPDDSKIFEAVTDDGDDRMPPAPRAPLTSGQIEAIRKWIAGGALNSDCPDQLCDTAGTISFSAQVDRILQGNCVGCHNSAQASGGINLAGYSNVFQAATALRNGTPLLLGTIGRQSGFVAMPPGFTLGSCDVAILSKWVENGSADN